METRLKISDIDVSHRHRKEFGDLQGLAASIKADGLMQAIGVTKKGHKLIFGERRLRASKMNGETEIDCRIIDIESVWRGEYVENEFRKGYTITEKAAIAATLEAEKVERRGRPKKGTEINSKLLLNKDHNKNTTASKIATAAGFSGKDEYLRVKSVMEKGTPELIKAMDEGKVKISAAAEIVKNTSIKKSVNGKTVVVPVHSAQKKVLEATLSSGTFPKKSRAVLFTEHVEEITARVWGIESEYGSVEKMMESVQWKSSTPDEKRKCVKAVVVASQELSELAKAMENYSKKFLK